MNRFYITKMEVESEVCEGLILKKTSYWIIEQVIREITYHKHKKRHGRKQSDPTCLPSSTVSR